MSTLFYNPQIPDSAKTPQQADTFSSPGLQQKYTLPGSDDTTAGYFPEPSVSLFQQQAAAVTAIPKLETGTPLRAVTPRIENYQGWNSTRNFFAENGLKGIVADSRVLTKKGSAPVFSSSLKPATITPQPRYLNTYDWFLGIFLLLTLLFIWIRVFYSKFFATLGNALISFQISAKLFRERNVLTRRFSIILDFIYILVISIFINELTVHFGLTGQGMSRFNLFLLFLNIIIFYTLLRIFILRLTGYLFMAQSLFSEYIHNTFVINKGMGIALFPVVIMAHYFPKQLIPLVLTLGIIICILAFIFKSIRAYQIIIRKDVLIFYLILYLCTLEILPLLLGYKVVTSLI